MQMNVQTIPTLSDREAAPAREAGGLAVQLAREVTIVIDVRRANQ